MKKKYIYIVFVLIVVGVGYCYYAFYYNNIFNIARRYIDENQINTNNIVYIPLNKLKYGNKYASCNNASGVIVKNNDIKLYTKCSNNESNIISNKSEYISLNGKEVIVLNVGEPYVELGVNKKDENVLVKVLGSVSDNTGIYVIKYMAYIDNNYIETIERYVIVTENKNINLNGKNNNDYPVATLKGNDLIDVDYHSIYEELGVNMNNHENQLKIVGNVDTNKLGKYEIFYIISDSDGDSTFLKRTVNVIKSKTNLVIDIIQDNNYTNKFTKIQFNITGNGYSHTILPNGIRTEESSFSYEFEMNGAYEFKIYDINDDEIVKEVVVQNIDKEQPNGSCSAIVKNKEINFMVSATDNNEIENYEYSINNQFVLKNEHYYTHKGIYLKINLPKLSVKISDKAGNSVLIDCNIENKIESEIYQDINGNQCLEPYICYKQRDYNDPYQATSNGVGTIYTSGCLPVSMTIISTLYDKRSSNGNLFTPPVLIKELIYPNGKIVGYSNYSRVVEIGNKLNLKVSQKYNMKNDVEIFKEHLKSGHPIIINTNDGCYSTGAHYLAVIGMNDEGKVFVSDPYSKTTKSMTGKCTVNAWTDVSEVVNKGGVNYFALIND